MKPKISIVVPSYNKVKFIELTLKSIFSQNYKNLEVIIQDGGSTDGSVQIIKKYAKKYPIIWVSKKDKGQTDAVNTGLKKATGQILTFINADDCYKHNTLSLVANTYIKYPKALWFVGQSMVIDENGKEKAKLVTRYKNLLLFLNSKFYLLITNYLMQPSVFFTKEAYKKYGPFIGTSDFICEYDFWLKLAHVSMPMVLNKCISKFRIEPNTKTKRMFKSLLFEDVKIVKKYTNSPLILFLHELHNLGRVLIAKFV
jgi:glycosyltransferase involved in cell wall biosynthesis